MYHLAGFYSSVDPGGVLTELAAIQDQVVTTNGNDLRVPNGFNNIVGAAAFINDASAARAQLDSPSLRTVFNPDIEPLEADVLPKAAFRNYLNGDNPLPLVVNESLNFLVQSNPAAAADHYGIVLLGDGPVQPVKGNIFTIQATATIQQAVGKWVNGNITFDQTLPAGSYSVVGMRARATGLVAARLVFVGGTVRPGVLGVQVVTDPDWDGTRMGAGGVLGQFDNTTPPTLDVLGGTAAAQTLLLDLVRVK